MAKITGVLVNVNRGTVKKLTINHSLDGFYKALGVSCIDIQSRVLGGKRFDFICDDEALLKDKPTLSAHFSAYDNLFGNLFIVNHDDEGNEISLTDEEITHILQHAVTHCDTTATSLRAYFILMDF